MMINSKCNGWILSFFMQNQITTYSTRRHFRLQDDEYIYNGQRKTDHDSE